MPFNKKKWLNFTSQIEGNSIVNKENPKYWSTIEIKNLFTNRLDQESLDFAYLSFISNSPWGKNFDFERGIGRVLLQLRLPLYKGKGISWSSKMVNPEKIWASEDTLDYDKVEMVKAATSYMMESEKPMPPVLIWLIKTESKYNLVCHDGHHRVYVYNSLKQNIPAIIMEYWIDNREDPILPKKLHYHKINQYVKNMPVVERDFSEYCVDL